MKSRELFKLLAKDGWVEKRQTGSHVIMVHPIKEGEIVAPFHGAKEVKTGTLNAILKQAGIKTAKR